MNHVEEKNNLLIYNKVVSKMEIVIEDSSVTASVGL